MNPIYKLDNLIKTLATNLSPVILLLTRVIIGYMFLLHGLQKLTGGVELTSLMGVGGIIETLGGIFIILGLFTRFTAFILAGQMAVAYFMFHASAETLFNPVENQGELAVLYSMTYLILMITGAGRISLDAKFNK
ncbi:DoxX family protein [Basfia succiniciproducens]|uniref:Oxidoreductase n=1 Tax=Basfia succiniciproducens TaxID=653940 RepID=A0A1G5EB12_9PAST|nr:DoxX family protein [Basfia succiniciproducens]QIM69260.1 LuxR family transcriptional regulator [Basfia succiniciproducens]SCY23941.1 putative oxidoreductase [Basfia succiniciproducens]